MADKLPEISLQNESPNTSSNIEKIILNDEQIFEDAKKYSWHHSTRIFLLVQDIVTKEKGNNPVTEEIFSDKNIFDIEWIKKSFKDYIENEWRSSGKEVPELFSEKINLLVMERVEELKKKIRDEIINKPKVETMEQRISML